MSRPYNFSAGPGCQKEVLQQTLTDARLAGSGMSVMEMSHRGKEFISMRVLKRLPSSWIPVHAGGGLAESCPAIVTQGTSADFVVTGSWSEIRSEKEAWYFVGALGK
jgi:phosphoserine aminotransferase